MDLTSAYHLMPLALQEAAITAYGAYIKASRYGAQFWRYVDWLVANETLSSAEISSLQEDMLNRMLVSSFQSVPYYRREWRNLGIDDETTSASDRLKRIRPVDKASIRSVRSGLLSDSYRNRHLVSYVTGGTTGSAFEFRFTLDQICYNFAFGEARIRRWGGTSLAAKTAVFLGKRIVPPGQRTPPFWRNDRANNQRLYSIFHLNESTAKYYVRSLEDFQPEIIVGYPTPLAAIADAATRCGIRTVRPKVIWSTSETLMPQHRTAIESAFGCSVTNAYSSAEGVAFVSQCRHGCLHISPEFGFVELEPIPGSPGYFEIIGTTLFNYSMPLIRYRTGDVVTQGHQEAECTLPFPVVGDVLGRMDDLVVTPSGRLISSAPLSLVFSSTSEIAEAQIVQTHSDRILVRIVPLGAIRSGLLQRLETEIYERTGGELGIDFDLVDHIDRTASGKYQFVRSEIR